MRCDQYIGLNGWAKRLVTRKQQVREIGIQILPGGVKKSFNRWRRVPVVRTEHAGVIRGAYKAQVAKLHRYTLPTGEQYVEYLQAQPWSGGPCYFIALKDKHGNPVPESLWTDEEIAQA
jgi:hypothetical protein